MSLGMDNAMETKKRTAFDRAYYIHELNKIDQNIAKLLRSAGEAVQALTLQADKPELTAEERKSAFSKAASDYFAALSYVDVNLRRQVYALEEANIIPVDIPKETATAADGAKAVVGSGVMGNLDIGWLNSRNDKVGTDMDAELWTQAKELLAGFDIDAACAAIGNSNVAEP